MSRVGVSNPPHMVYGSRRQSFTANTLLAGRGEHTNGQHDTDRRRECQGLTAVYEPRRNAMRQPEIKAMAMLSVRP